ncbi:hypothetical protein [Dermacoccus barathri]|uniref:Uncharacterized protein n=1 Tax=Dermacoccus barathri TaxID=322601 RepID=A0ABN2B4N4_9MICO
MFENDLGFSNFTPRELVNFFQDDPADYISRNVVPMEPQNLWYGTLTSRGFEGTEHKSFYPLTRVTRAASDAAVALRRRTQFATSDLMTPNDEIVMASAAVEAGLSVRSLESGLPMELGRFTARRPLPFPYLRLRHRGPQIFHPVGPLNWHPRRSVKAITDG